MPEVIALGVAGFLAWLMGSAALHKLRSTGHYRQLMGKYLNGLPVNAAGVWLIAALESGLALCLLVPQTRPYALAVAALLLIAYAALMALQLARGRADMKCGCAGPASDTSISPTLVLRNLFCAVLATLAIVPGTPAEFGIVGGGLALFVGTFAALAYLSSEQLIANSQQMAGER